MPIQINGSGTITGLSEGGIEDAKIIPADLKASSGTAGSGTYYRGDGAWGTPAAGNPVIQVDRWRYRSNISSDGTVLTDWERPDASETSPGRLGTGMTHSSGKFSFPATGIWEVRCTMMCEVDGNESEANILTQITNDDSSYTTAFMTRLGDRNSGVGDVKMMAYGSGFFDITNTTNQHFRFKTDSFGATTLMGDNNEDATYVDFIRWGDT